MFNSLSNYGSAVKHNDLPGRLSAVFPVMVCCLPIAITSINSVERELSFPKDIFKLPKRPEHIGEWSKAATRNLKEGQLLRYEQ